MLTKIYADTPDYAVVREVVQCLESGGVIIYPTGVGYALGCSALKKRAVEQVCQIKGVDSKRHTLAIMCQDLGEVAQYAKLENETFALMKSGKYEPATYILPPTTTLPTPFRQRKEVGVQLCKHPVTRIILEELEAPLLTGSLPDLPEGYDMNYLTDPELIEEYYGHQVDLIIDGGVAPGGHGAIIDCTGETPQLLREGTI